MCTQVKASFYSIFFVVVFWNRPHENLFCSSSSISQFPGRNGHTGSNVQQISVSVPLFPCVNALTSKNTTSLCIYCVDGGCRLLSISPLLDCRCLEISGWWEWAVMRASMRACACQRRWTCGFVQVRVHHTGFIVMNPLQGSSAVIICIWNLVERLESDANAGWLCSISSSDLCEKATLETLWKQAQSGVLNVCSSVQFVFLTMICEENKQNLTYFCLCGWHWTPRTLIHMCRGLGHGQPRFSSRLESLAEGLKMSDGLPLELLHDCLIPEKDHLHFTSKTPPPSPWTTTLKKILVDRTELGRGICFYPQMP